MRKHIFLRVPKKFTTTGNWTPNLWQQHAYTNTMQGPMMARNTQQQWGTPHDSKECPMLYSSWNQGHSASGSNNMKWQLGRRTCRRMYCQIWMRQGKHMVYNLIEIGRGIDTPGGMDQGYGRGRVRVGFLLPFPYPYPWGGFKGIQGHALRGF